MIPQELVSLLTSLVLPPGILVLLGLAGLVLSRHLLGKLLLLITLSALYLLSTPAISQQLLLSLETTPPLNSARLGNLEAEAILVLGGGRYNAAPEYGGDTVSAALLERLRYASTLARKTKLPVIPCGGSASTEGTPEAELAREVLEKEFGIRVFAIESESRTTRENAVFAADLLARKKIGRVLLVTHAWHMPRALETFRHYGVDAIPAPTGFTTAKGFDTDLFHWIPQARALLQSSQALHEKLGLLWYRLSS